MKSLVIPQESIRRSEIVKNIKQSRSAVAEGNSRHLLRYICLWAIRPDQGWWCRHLSLFGSDSIQYESGYPDFLWSFTNFSLKLVWADQFGALRGT